MTDLRTEGDELSSFAGNLTTEFEREDEVNLYDCLPHSITFGTSYDYYCKFPMFDEEMFYLLECSTLNNAEPDEVIQRCREIASMRNKYILDNFEKSSNPYEMEIDISELDYNKIPYELSPTTVSTEPELHSQ